MSPLPLPGRPGVVGINPRPETRGQAASPSSNSLAHRLTINRSYFKVIFRIGLVLVAPLVLSQLSVRSLLRNELTDAIRLRYAFKFEMGLKLCRSFIENIPHLRYRISTPKFSKDNSTTR